MHQNLSCSPYSFSSEIGIGTLLLLFVISFESLNPVLKPSSKLFFRVKVPFADPITVSSWRDWSGRKVSKFESYFNLFPD